MPKRTCQPKFRVRFDCRDDTAEHRRGNDVDLIEKDEAPLSRGKELHHLLRIMRPIMGICDHRIGRDYNAAFTGKLNGD